MNNRPLPISLGWKQIVRDYTIVQGNAANISFTVTALRPDNTPYPSYVGFTGLFSLYSPGGTLIKSLSTEDNEIVITPNATEHTLDIVIKISSVNSLSFPSHENLSGDLLVIAPDEIEHQYPFKMNLKVFQSFTRLP